MLKEKLDIEQLEEEMKTQTQIEQALQRFDAQKSQFPGMTYEQGIEEALMWVLGELQDDEFSALTQDA